MVVCFHTLHCCLGGTWETLTRKSSIHTAQETTPFFYSWLLPEQVTTEKQVTTCEEPDSQQRSNLRGFQGQNLSRWRKVLSAQGREAETLRNNHKRKTRTVSQAHRLQSRHFSLCFHICKCLHRSQLLSRIY